MLTAWAIIATISALILAVIAFVGRLLCLGCDIDLERMQEDRNHWRRLARSREDRIDELEDEANALAGHVVAAARKIA